MSTREETPEYASPTALVPVGTGYLDYGLTFPTIQPARRKCKRERCAGQQSQSDEHIEPAPACSPSPNDRCQVD